MSCCTRWHVTISNSRTGTTESEILFSPSVVADWLRDTAHRIVRPTRVMTMEDHTWVATFDADEEEYLWQQNYRALCRGDSVRITVPGRHRCYELRADALLALSTVDDASDQLSPL